MKFKWSFYFLLVISVHNVVGLDKRLQNSNIDFLNFEGHRVQPPTTPKAVIFNPNAKATTPSTTTTTAENLNPALPAVPPSNTVTGQNKPTGTNIQAQGTAGNVAPNQPASTNSNVKPATPNTGNQQPSRGQPVPLTPNAGGTQSNIPQNQPGPAANTNPNSPKPASNPVLPGLSWSSIVSGNKQGTTSKPHVISPENTPKSAQNLQPIDIGGGWPLPGATQAPAAASKGPEVMSDQELKDLSEVLLNKDTSNLSRLITVNYQGRTTSFSKDDVSPGPLFTIQSALWNVPTVAKMKVLYDNYEQDVTVNEHVTALEKNEENEFLDAVMATPLMRHLLTTLKDKGVLSADVKQQRDAIKTIWFNTYSRGQGKIGSSGFEHIFLSEIKNREISGLHNWIYFSSEEATNNINYLGYMKKVEFGDKGGILKLHFNMKTIDKPVATMFVGTSPELELALYSLCFFTRVDRACPLSLAGQTFNLRTHNYRYRGKNMIGSAFPEI